MKELICQGCGSILQDEDPNKKGFIQVIDRTKTELYCKRCYRLMHYNELPKIIATNEEYEQVVNNLLKYNGIIVLVIDLFDFTGTFIPKILEKLRNKPVILVANKLDLLPKSANIAKIVDWLSYMANRMFFKLDAIHVVSSKKGYFIDELMHTIDFLRNGRDVYFMGCANVGKSSLINTLIKKYTSKTDDIISTSPIPGTTLNSIKVPFFEDNKAFIDTPGLINEGNILSHILPDSYDKILPKTEIKPITYQLKSDNCVFFGGLGYVSLIKGEDISFSCYFSKNVVLHRRKSVDADEFLKRQIGKVLVPPTEKESSNLEYEVKQFEIKSDSKYELVISGLGFISLNKPCKLSVKIIKGTDVFVRYGILGNKN